MRRPHPRWVVLTVPAALALALTGCTSRLGTMPDCSAPRRLAIVAQAVPGAAYVPCIEEVPEGWSVGELDAGRDHARFSLVADRARGRRVRVELAPTCPSTGAVPATPRAEGVRTAIALRSISPRYAGTLHDIFAGGCITYRFDFPRGPHIALMEELQATVGLVARRQLRLEIDHDLGVDIGA